MLRSRSECWRPRGMSRFGDGGWTWAKWNLGWPSLGEPSGSSSRAPLAPRLRPRPRRGRTAGTVSDERPLPALRVADRSGVAPRSRSASPVAPGRGSLHGAELRDPVPAQPRRSGGAVPAVPRAVAMRAAGSESQALLPAAAGRLSPGDRAFDVALGPIAAGEGVRVGFLGDPGSGKSYAARAFARAYLARSRGLV